MAKVDKTFAPQNIAELVSGEPYCAHCEAEFNAAMRKDTESGHFQSNYATDKDGNLVLNSVNYIPPEKQKKLTDYYQSRAEAAHKELQDLDQRFAILLEQYAGDLKGVQCFDNYPPIEYERYIEEFLEILRQYRLRINFTRLM